KSTALLQVAYNYEELGRKVQIVTAEIDTRYGPGLVSSRLGPKRKARTFNADLDFFEWFSKTDDLACILIDEAQFLTREQVRQLHRVAHVLNVPVICYGIRSDFLGEPFPGAIYLLTLADSLEELKTICPCGRKATMNVRFDPDGKRTLSGSQIAIEGEVRYVPMCGACFYQSD
ncbi:MAG: thymidine kinase, partial [Candidatus Baltobacteraceae bacterium]